MPLLANLTVPSLLVLLLTVEGLLPVEAVVVPVLLVVLPVLAVDEVYMPPLNHIPPRSQCIKRACHPAPAFVEHMGINHCGAHIAMP